MCLEGSGPVDQADDDLVDTEANERSEVAARGRALAAVDSGTGDQPRDGGCDKDDRHDPRRQQLGQAHEERMLADELIDGVLDRVVHENPWSTAASRYHRGIQQLYAAGLQCA